MIIDSSLQERLRSSKAILFDLKGTLDFFNGSNFVLMPSALLFIESLVSANKKLGLVTSTSKGHAITMLNKFGISEDFDLIISSDDVTVTKPSPEPYLKAIHELKINPVDCIVFEDSYNGLRSAKGAGLFTVYFHYARNPDDLNLALADVSIDSYDGLDTVFQQ